MEITSASAAQSIAEASADSKSLSQDFDQFLVLLTTQLQNQDPLSPMDSTEFTNQLVAFSGVEQQIKTNEQLAAVVNSSQAMQTNLGLSYIGLQISMDSNAFKFYEGAQMAGSYTLPKDAATGTMTILNSDGELVHSQDIELSAGKHAFTWDGLDNEGNPAPSGTYTVQVGAIDEAGKSFTATTTVPGLVEGIETTEAGEVLLLVNDQLVPISDVKRAKL